MKLVILAASLGAIASAAPFSAPCLNMGTGNNTSCQNAGLKPIARFSPSPTTNLTLAALHSEHNATFVKVCCLLVLYT